MSTPTATGPNTPANNGPARAPRAIFWIIFVLALLVRIAFALYSRQYLVLDEKTELVGVAHALAAKGAFADPYKFPTGPTAHVAPVYPFALSLLYRVFGFSEAAELVKELLVTLASALEYALLPAAALAFGFPWRAGLLAGFAGALLPLFPYLETKGEWEGPYGALALLLIAMSVARAGLRLDVTDRAAAWRGIAWGFALLLAPAVLPALAAFLFLEIWRSRRLAAAHPWRRAAIMTAVAFAIQVPWIVRNTLALGAPVWTRDNFGLELMLSNNPRALPTADEILANGSFSDLHPNGSAAEAAKVKRMGEIAYNREKSREAFAWIEAHPGAFARLTERRFLYFWFPKVNVPSKYMLLWLVTACGLAGLWRMANHNAVAFRIFGALWLVFPLVYYTVQNIPRYSYPLYWSLLLAAGYAVSGWIDAIRNRLFARA